MSFEFALSFTTYNNLPASMQRSQEPAPLRVPQSHSAENVLWSLRLVLETARARAEDEPGSTGLSPEVWALNTASKLFYQTSALDSVLAVFAGLDEKNSAQRACEADFIDDILSYSGERIWDFFLSQDDWAEPHDRDGYDLLYETKADEADDNTEKSTWSDDDEDGPSGPESPSVETSFAHKQSWEEPKSEKAAEVWRRTFLAGALQCAGVEYYPEEVDVEPQSMRDTSRRIQAAFERLEQLVRKGQLRPSSNPTDWSRAFSQQMDPVDQLNCLSALWPIVQEIGNNREWIDEFEAGQPRHANQPPTDRELKWRALTSLVLESVSERYSSATGGPYVPPCWTSNYRSHKTSRVLKMKDTLRVFTDQVENALDQLERQETSETHEGICSNDCGDLPRDVRGG